MPKADELTLHSEAVISLILESCAFHAGHDDHLLRALRYHFETTGKQVRAHLVLSCARALSVEDDVARCLAASVECLHNASLVQDDLQDRTALRRGREPVWRRFGTDTAICLTDLLLSASYVVLAASGASALPALVQRLHNAVSQTLRGQMEDTGAQTLNDGLSAAESCLRVAVAKSGPFFALSLELPLIAAGEIPYVPVANSAAMHFGMGYQAFDDLEDLEQDEREGNVHNLVLAYARDGGDKDPLERARESALYHLQQACLQSMALPHGCGAALCTEARKLRSKIALS